VAGQKNKNTGSCGAFFQSITTFALAMGDYVKEKSNSKT